MDYIYLDHAATTACDPAVLQAMQPYFYGQFGNASSPHRFGRQARKAVEEAREKLAAFLGAAATEIVFTSGATEANNQAVLGVAQAAHPQGRHIVVSGIEHHSILEPVKRLAAQGYDITYVQPDAQGLIDPDALLSQVRPDTVLAAVGHANNEIGVIQNIPAMGRVLRERGVAFLVDAVQTVGHVPVDVRQLNCDFLTLSAHKFYGPQGVGALYIRKGALCQPLLSGGDQERGRRAGTSNVPGIVGLGQAAALAQISMEREAVGQISMRDSLIKRVLGEISTARLNGHPLQRLPNNAHFSFERLSGEELVAALDLAGIACSVGSACTSGQLEPSHVLKAIGLSDALALGSLRITLGKHTTLEQVHYLIEQLKLKVHQLR